MVKLEWDGGVCVSGVVMGDGGELIFLSTFPVQIHTMSSVSKEQITEAWTRLTEKNEKKMTIQIRSNSAMTKADEKLLSALLMMCELLNSLVSHIEITWNSHGDAALTLCTKCYKYGWMFWEFKLHRFGEDSWQQRTAIVQPQKQITIPPCICWVSRVIGLHYAVMNSSLKQASREQIITPLLI